jgi:Asp-tRNA(Asn)/Glu-tRNA(Gln) amidotransferase A subunit family amidase
MPTYVEDLDESPTALEGQLLAGLSMQKLDRLRVPLMRSVLVEKNPNAQARRVVQLAASLEPGALFDEYFSATYLAAFFRSKRRLLEVDALLQPYYGLVTAALGELRSAGIDPVITDMWLENFRQDHGHYRCQIIASMAVTGAYSDIGFTVSV